jgi:hypothetical protein
MYAPVAGSDELDPFIDDTGNYFLVMGDVHN